MSTKVTLRHGPYFHLYKECFDHDGIWLELVDCQAEITINDDHSDVTVRIPREVWTQIRECTI